MNAERTAVRNDYRNDKVSAKVNAVNKANAYANDIHGQLVEAFQPFVGTKVLKADGTLTAKVEKMLPAFPHTSALSVYRNRSDYTLTYVVKVCEPIGDGGSCLYHEVSVYVGDVRDGVLTAVAEPVNDRRTNYTVENASLAMEMVRVAEKALSDAKSALYPFDNF